MFTRLYPPFVSLYPRAESPLASYPVLDVYSIPVQDNILLFMSGGFPSGISPDLLQHMVEPILFGSFFLNCRILNLNIELYTNFAFYLDPL